MEAILNDEIDISLTPFIFDFGAYPRDCKVSIYHHSWEFQ